MQRIYIAIDLKSFYASVECRERGLDPLNTNLVVADESRTDKTICLAVSPSLKSLGVPGRPRLFEVKQKVAAINAQRRYDNRRKPFSGKSHFLSELAADPALELEFLIARPRMALYIDYSTRIYNIYLKYASAADIVVYSIDEVFIDVTNYLGVYKLSPRELTMKIILDVLESTGITATAGVGTNLFLAKVAMDIVAKHIPADENGVRIAELDEMSYRKTLWEHRPLRDFWRIGYGYASKLESRGLMTMGDIARCSIKNEDLLYKLFGKNAELLIDHAWGWEPTTVEAIKAFKPAANSLGSGQVLKTPYEKDKAAIVISEMADALSLDLVEKGLVTDRIGVSIAYDAENLSDPERKKRFSGETTADRYGRDVPKYSQGTANLGGFTSSSKKIVEAASEVFERAADPDLLIRRLAVTANRLLTEADAAKKENGPEQLDLFTDYEARDREREKQKAEQETEKKMQQALIGIKKKYGKNAILKGVSLKDGATGKERNDQIGGHKA